MVSRPIVPGGPAFQRVKLVERGGGGNGNGGIAAQAAVNGERAGQVSQVGTHLLYLGEIPGGRHGVRTQVGRKQRWT